MHLRSRWLLLSVLALLGVSVQLLSLLRSGGDLVGYDYVFFLPRLLEGILFFRAQGLSAPLYSSFFCGGFPYHADPQVMYYSLPQALSLLVDPWSAVESTAVVFLFVGGLAAYRCGRTVFLLSPEMSFALSVMFAANGFSRSRLLIGHLTYHGFPLIPVMLLALLDQSLRRSRGLALCALVLTYLVQSGGNYNLPIVVAASALTLPLVSLQAGKVRTREALIRFLGGAALAGGVCASKLVAGFAFSGAHPRLARFNHADSFREAAQTLFTQLFDPVGGARPFRFGPWEYDCTIAVLAPVGIALALVGAFRRTPVSGRVRAASVGVFLVLCLLVAQFSLGSASWVDSVKELPVLRQMRVNIRFTSILIFPLLVLAAIGFDRLRVRAIVALLVAASAFLPGEAIRETARTYMSFSAAAMPEFAERLRHDSYSIRAIVKHGSNDFEPLLEETSNADCYSVFFAKAPTRALEDGSVYDENGGTLNFVNPACYVYPEENRCTAGDRVPSSEREELSTLLAHRNPAWSLSPLQEAADALTKVFLGALVLTLFLPLPRLTRSPGSETDES